MKSRVSTEQANSFAYDMHQSRLVKPFALLAALFARIDAIAEFNKFSASDTIYVKAILYTWLNELDMKAEFTDHKLEIEHSGFNGSYQNCITIDIDLRVMGAGESIFFTVEDHAV